jgi:cation-transporting ATPase E
LTEPSRNPPLPRGLKAVALVTLEEVVRPDAEATLAAFATQGVAVKIISGDNPRTVLAIARRVGLPDSAEAISGAELAALSPEERAKALDRVTIFGRISPQEKQDIIRDLREGGHYVAMIGDGVNDVLALKQSNVGVAMRSGSAATRSAADVILLNDSFNVLPPALDEGRKVINAMLSLIKLFIIRDVSTIELILATILVSAPFPFLPTHGAVISFLTVGLPSLFVVAWASAARPRPETLREIAVPVLTIGTTSALAITSVFLLSLPFFGGNPMPARTAAVTAAMLSGSITLVLFWHPLTASLKTLLSDLRMVVLALLMVVSYYVILLAGPIPRYFELHNLSLFDLAIAVPVVLIWFGVMRLFVRSPVGSRWFN